jgi:uncharacterized protein (TIGR02145 family)
MKNKFLILTAMVSLITVLMECSGKEDSTRKIPERGFTHITFDTQENTSANKTPEMMESTSTDKATEPQKHENSFTDPRDGKKYRTVKIGSAIWMAENLNYQTDKSWCYDNDTSNCNKYGRLYDWNTAKNICPKGWRLPTNQDWDSLGKNAGATLIIGEDYDGDIYWKGAGKTLKSTSGWNSYDECEGWENRNYGKCNGDGNGTDNYGFSALPSGRRYTDGSFLGIGSHGYWWVSMEGGEGAYLWGMNSDNENLGVGSYGKDMGVSVRCLRAI